MFKTRPQHSTTAAFGLFSLLLSDNPAAPLELIMGGWREEYLEQELAWLPVERTYMGHWQVKVTGVQFGNIELTDFCTEGCWAFLDTGTTT